FNTAFRQMEDVELTYRIARRYAIVFAPEVLVHHEFEGFWLVAKKYFWRSFYWMKLYNERKKFDPVATTQWESLAALTAFTTVMAVGIGSSIFFVYPLYTIRYYTIHLSVLFFLLHVFLIRKFLIFVAQEKGMWFMIRSLIVGIVLYCFIVFGILYFYVIEKIGILSKNSKK
ncbi:MAG: hypothetical protein N3A54_07105, partial [Patescibacteria group bacterium]|nr:hypothetical protein [Patescibacteria group bacterium]